MHVLGFAGMAGFGSSSKTACTRSGLYQLTAIGLSSPLLRLYTPHSGFGFMLLAVFCVLLKACIKPVMASRRLVVHRGIGIVTASLQQY